MIQESILELVKYGLATGLVEKEDAVFTANSLLELFRLDDIEDSIFEKYVSQPSWTQQEAEECLEGILEDMMTYAYDNERLLQLPRMQSRALIQSVSFARKTRDMREESITRQDRTIELSL